MEDFLRKKLEESKQRFLELNGDVERSIAETHKFLGMREEANLNIQKCQKACDDYFDGQIGLSDPA